MEAGPLLAVLEIGLTKVDAGIQVVGEGLGDRLDALAVDTGGGEQKLCGLQVTVLDRLDEGVGLLLQRGGLGPDVAQVASTAAVTVSLPSVRSPESPVTFRSWLIPSPTMPGLQVAW